MHEIVLRRIEFAVHDAGARAHALHVARLDDRTGAHAVLVLQRAFQHVADDFHIAVAVRAETHARLHAVFVDHAQRAKAHFLRIMVIGEGKRVVAVQPAVIGMAAVFCLADA